MTEREPSPEPFQLGDFRVVPARNRLMRDGVEYTLEPRVMDVLCALADADGEVLSRDALINRVWRREWGADESLTRAISILRKVVREAGDQEPYIETIKKRGYRLSQPVVRLALGDEPGIARRGDRPEAPASSARRLVPRMTIAAVAAVIAATLFLVVFRAGDPAPEQGAADMRVPSVAVLPLRSLSNDESDAYFGKGLAEELLNALARYPGLKVVGRTSSFAIDVDPLDSPEVGRQLNADFIVEGSVRRSGERVRISTQLVRTSDNVQLWTETYEPSMTDLFAVEDEIVREIARALEVRIGIGAGSGRSDSAGIDPAAYDAYLKALTLWGDRMRENDNRSAALASLQRAVEFDPNFAGAWASIGVIGAYSAGSPLARDRGAFRQMTEQAFARALALDENNSVAHAGLALWHVSQHIDVDAALHHLERAKALAPNAVETHYVEAAVYRALGDWQRSLAAYDRAIVLDPLNTIMKLARAQLQMQIGQADQGMAFMTACRDTACLGEGFVVFGTVAAILSGDADTIASWEPALAEFEAAVAGLPAEALPHVQRLMPAFFSIRLGRADAPAQIERMQQLFREEIITDTPGIWLPTFAEFLPQDTVMAVLETAYERGDLFSAAYALSPYYGANPYPDWVLRHPRYRQLWERPGMPELEARWRAMGLTSGLPVAP